MLTVEKTMKKEKRRKEEKREEEGRGRGGRRGGEREGERKRRRKRKRREKRKDSYSLLVRVQNDLASLEGRWATSVKVHFLFDPDLNFRNFILHRCVISLCVQGR